MTRTGVLFFGAVLASTTWVMAQDATNPVGSKSDWVIFVEEDPKQCWVVSPPKETVNTRSGRVVAVNRGDIYLFVSFWPGVGEGSRDGDGGMGEVSFVGGYEFADNSTVTLEIGTDRFELFTEGTTAWAASPEDDRKIASAMKRGASAVLTGLSKRSSTTTKDTFSLIGFTAAYEDAERRCAP
ncbi:MAG: invasion associated locus B family protein [Mangrovicoccus sp.]